MPEVAIPMVSGTHPVVWMVKERSFFCLDTVGVWRKVRNFEVAISSPKIMEKAETISAFHCKPSSEAMTDRRSSAYAISLQDASIPEYSLM